MKLLVVANMLPVLILHMLQHNSSNDTNQRDHDSIAFSYTRVHLHFEYPVYIHPANTCRQAPTLASI
ncbi:hypothetical protein PVAP13_7KG422001 [Panicum virgatum]|uniref:Secreted protein n=1 Tax=Panicum virgatum TaxID=38727 RepID=A0A8T0QQE2_PANVG|nr:hypothetical protein PVAP13_7KG422001 [Panicum virgatum]